MYKKIKYDSDDSKLLGIHAHILGDDRIKK